APRRPPAGDGELERVIVDVLGVRLRLDIADEACERERDADLLAIVHRAHRAGRADEPLIADHLVDRADDAVVAVARSAEPALTRHLVPLLARHEREP